MSEFAISISTKIRGQSENPVAVLTPYAHNFASLYRKNGISATTLN